VATPPHDIRIAPRYGCPCEACISERQHRASGRSRDECIASWCLGKRRSSVPGVTDRAQTAMPVKRQRWIVRGLTLLGRLLTGRQG
jgi:hypothetical protein